MKRRILFYLVIVIQVVHQISGSEVIAAKKSRASKLKINPECRKIKCPLVSEPLCVRLKYITSALQSRTVYVVMLNRCEMKYVTCHKGAEAKVLPMVHCDHGKNITSDLKALEQKIRNMDSKISSPRTIDLKAPKGKRRSMGSKILSSKTNGKKTINKNKKVGLVSAMPKLLRLKRKAVYNEKRNHIQDDEKQYTVAKKREEMGHINAVKKHLFSNTTIKKIKKIHKKNLRNNSDSLEDDNDNENDNENSAALNSTEDVDFQLYTKNAKKENAEEVHDYDEGKEENDVSISVSGRNSREVKINEDSYYIETVEGIPRKDFFINSGERRSREKVDLEDYKSDCPKICPSRGVMLCGRCKDGIYRTFPSVCHMRMFDCGHPEEKLTLISRYPCAMSGPYLEDLRVPKGLVKEPHDVDPVLNHLKCGEYMSKKLAPFARKIGCIRPRGN